MIAQPKNKRWQSKKWRDAAQGQPCTLRIPGCCNHNPETTVLAHANGAGMALKADDFRGCDACAECHNALDGLKGSALFSIAMDRFHDAMLETIKNRLERKILK